MKIAIFKKFNVIKSIASIIFLLFTVFKIYGQQSNPALSGYAPVNGAKVYYEVYGEGKLIILLNGAFYDHLE